MATRVLIYEDDVIASMMLELMMKDEGCTVLAKKDTADDLVGDVAEHEPDLILLDIMLVGEKLGTQAAVELRQSSNVPIIFTSALNDTDTLDVINSLSHAILVGKPYDKDRLIAAMVKLV